MPPRRSLFVLLAAFWANTPLPAQTAVFRGTTFVNQGLVGVGRIPASQRDLLGETFGSLSGLAPEIRSWRRLADGSLTGTLFAQPDRGYTRNGTTTSYRARRHRLTATLLPSPAGSNRQDQITLALTETLLLTDPDGAPLTGLDPTPSEAASRPGFPPLPRGSTLRLSLDAEGLGLLPDGSFLVSDEYGPYLYRFSPTGTLLGAIRPPEALIPKRNGRDSFSSDSPAVGQPSPSPREPDTGRENNQGLEGLSVSADGRTVYALLQSATRQDGGAGGNTQRRHTRLLAYDLSNPAAPSLSGEWILPLPTYQDGNTTQVASVGDLVALNPRQFLVLVRDGNGRGSVNSRSLCRQVLIYDTGDATNLAGSVYDQPSFPAAPGGILAPAITPAISAVLIDLNAPDQLAKFNLNNSANDNADTLAEKWESLALLPALDPSTPHDFFLLIGNDNDFTTTDGYQDGSSYRASFNLDSMVLAYRITAPGTLTLPSFAVQPTGRTAIIGQPTSLSTTVMGLPSPTLQWCVDGRPIPGATGTSLSFSNPQASDTGSYTVIATNSAGAVTSDSVTLRVNPAEAPEFLSHPGSHSVAPGTSVVLEASATRNPSYQWRRNGLALTGATNRILLIPRAGAAEAGTYTVLASNGFGSATSEPATLAISAASTAEQGRLVNLSILTTLAGNETGFTLGTVIGGAGTTGSKPLLVRAAGPSLAPLGVPNALADPQLELFAGQASAATNDNWDGSPSLVNVFNQVGAFPFSSAGSRDAALFLPAAVARDYTVRITANSPASGAVLAEMYDATPAASLSATSPRLINLSVLKSISPGSVLTAGFVIAGVTSKTVLIRCVGPRLALSPFNLPGALVDPRLELFLGSAPLAANDNWEGNSTVANASTSVGAFALPDPGSRDAVILITLRPGAYTAQAGGANGAGGLALVEFYEVP